ncbi:MAG: ferrous iron transport protein B [Ignavibacteria bacterium]|nr:ferrous iron transport protein B [Ignavibacteria bacterium]
MNVKQEEATRVRNIALIGNPNSGKTTVFNQLTGLRQKVGNYPGVTVEKKEGRVPLPDDSEASVLDLPGTYSLTANSPDEKIATDILLGRVTHTRTPELVVCVVDASNLERSLYLVTQIIDRNLPLILVLNMMDIARDSGIEIDVNKLQHALNVEVIATVASRGTGIQELKQAMTSTHKATGNSRQWRLPELVERELAELQAMLEQHHQLSEPLAFHEAVTLLSGHNGTAGHRNKYSPEILDHLHKDHARLDFMGIDRQSVFIESRYEWVRRVCAEAVITAHRSDVTFSDKIDGILTHRIWGFVIFFGLMALMFQTIFSWAALPMELIGAGFDWFGRLISDVLPPGDLQDLIVNGGLAGVAAVVTFLPQILFLFFFLGVLEDTGYMARAAFIMDRLMAKVGLNGKSFIPLLGSFACAIPGIMATRTIEHPRDRLVTMLVAPLMSCSARLPVYTLLIAAFIPAVTVFGVFSLAGITLLSMYLLGLGAALGMAWILRRTLLKGSPPVFLMELPPYRLPSLKSIFIQMWERSVIFLKRAGTFILGVSIILWFLSTYPRFEGASPSDQVQKSFAGQAGKLIEPVLKPLGFDWKIGIGLIGSLLQREVFVSTMGTIYNIQNADDGTGNVSLQSRMQQDRDPVTGIPTFTMLTAICVMVYYVFAMQCLSTVAIMRRETNGWKWPAFQFGYMTLLAYGATFITYRLGLVLGIGG